MFPHTDRDYPIDYPVPDFGLDHDIVSSQENEANAIKTLKNRPDNQPYEKRSLQDLNEKLKKEAAEAIAKVVAGEEGT